jgi:hypothetical protein
MMLVRALADFRRKGVKEALAWLLAVLPMTMRTARIEAEKQ